MSGLSENWTFHKANFPRCWGDIITPEHHSFTLTYGYIYKKKTNLTPIKTQDTDRAENWKNLGFFFSFFFLLPLRLEVFHVSEMINVKFQSFSFCVSDVTHNITNKMNFFFFNIFNLGMSQNQTRLLDGGGGTQRRRFVRWCDWWEKFRVHLEEKRTVCLY